MTKRLILILMVLLVLTQHIFVAFSVTNDPIEVIITREMVEHNLPGLAYVYIEDGTVRYADASGYSDIALNEAMSLTDTVIQVGAISKVVTSYALLKLIEDNGLSLDDLIGPYLPSYLQKQTQFSGLSFKHILLHHSGFSSLKMNTATANNPLRSDKVAFQEQAYHFFMAHDFEPIIEPETYMLFSNVNNVVAGLLIEGLSGMSYERYLATKVFIPLGMSNTARLILEQPLGRLELMKPYQVIGGSRQPLDHFSANLLASDDLLTTPQEMGYLMSYFLSDAVSDFMSTSLFSRVYSNSDFGGGRSYAFSYLRYGDTDVYLQDGGTPGSNARLLLIPDKNAALFIVYNSQRLEAKDSVTDAIFAETLIAQRQAIQYTPYSHRSMDKLAGVYAPLNASKETVEKLTKTIHQVRISSKANGLLIGKDLYSPISETVFYNEDRHTYASFIINDAGQFQALVVGNDVYVKSKFYESFFLWAFIFIIGALINGATLLFLFIKWQALKVNRIHDTPRAILLLQTLSMSALLMFIFMVSRHYNIWDIIYGGNIYLRLIRGSAYLSLLLLLPSAMMIHRTHQDFRCPRIVLFLLKLQWVTIVLVLMWSLQNTFM